MIKIQNLSKHIHGQEILSDVTFSIGEGKITGIVGRNGVGKTTLLKTIVDVLRPDEGEVLVNGQNVQKRPDVKRNVIFVSDMAEALKNESTKSVVNLYKEIYPSFDQTYFYELMERFDMKEAKKIKHYSKGKKALFSLIMAFATRATYILLDEPTDGLDVIIKRQILKFMVEEVAKEDISIVIATHRLDELETLADHILVMKAGRIDSEYHIEEVKQSYKKVQLVFKGEMPEELKQYVYLLEQSGRVYICLLESTGDLTDEYVNSFQPLLYDELPMTLEDLFLARLGGDEVVS
ncbi:ATP-binding cassette domain-containing protein [Salsuginibacillus kocurii]|uniref:ABC transporter ATP-binding protein n=1 Tax=Salsuginibacillus kocurii TaxID=427078 RepID=UPI00037AD243|nr:ABC transporter ATP-binding protein [Salsuginibacillus kocurii]